MGKYLKAFRVATAGEAAGSSRYLISTHCLDGRHDYGYSDKCLCPCHESSTTGSSGSWPTVLVLR